MLIYVVITIFILCLLNVMFYNLYCTQKTDAKNYKLQYCHILAEHKELFETNKNLEAKYRQMTNQLEREMVNHRVSKAVDKQLSSTKDIQPAKSHKKVSKLVVEKNIPQQKVKHLSDASMNALVLPSKELV